MKQFQILFDQHIQPIVPVVKKISLNGGISFLVGGIVRDLLMNMNNSRVNKIFDLDIEVHGISLQNLMEILGSFCPVFETGKHFAVLKTPKYNADWSLPRKDSFGRKPNVLIEPSLSVKEAFQRRDITINSIGVNLNNIVKDWKKISFEKFNFKKLITKKIINLEDPFCGFLDIKQKIIRPTCREKFIEDPLRLFRVMQFIARFNYQTSLEMDLTAKEMIVETKNKKSDSFIAKERITDEFLKMLLNSKNPMKGLLWLKKVNKLSTLSPVLDKLTKSKLKLISKSWEKINKKVVTNEKKLIFFLGIILFFTKEKNKGQTVFFESFIVSKGLEKTAKRLCQIIQKVIPENKKDLLFFVNEIYPCTFLDVITIAFACNLLSKRQVKMFLKIGKIENILIRPRKAILSGADLLTKFREGPLIGELLKKAYKIQIENNLTDRFSILSKLLKDSSG